MHRSRVVIAAAVGFFIRDTDGDERHGDLVRSQQLLDFFQLLALQRGINPAPASTISQIDRLQQQILNGRAAILRPEASADALLLLRLGADHDAQRRLLQMRCIGMQLRQLHTYRPVRDHIKRPRPRIARAGGQHCRLQHQLHIGLRNVLIGDILPDTSSVLHHIKKIHRNSPFLYLRAASEPHAAFFAVACEPRDASA